MTRAGAALRLGWRFLVGMVVSGGQTAGLILRTRPGRGRATPAFICLHIAPLDPRAAALLGCLVALTPGSTVVDIDPARGELLLHVLDRDSAAAVAAGIHDDYVPLLRTLFGAAP